nr:protein FAR1-RELATED SEQUENCE 5-like [Ipomoea batatas]
MEANGAEMWENNSGSEENGEQEAECEMEISPNGAKQWIPTATPEKTPYTGQKFKTVDEGIEFYKAYAKAVGFDVRHGTMRKTRGGEVGIKYMGWRKYQENILYPDGQEMLRKTNAYIWWAKGVNTQADAKNREGASALPPDSNQLTTASFGRSFNAPKTGSLGPPDPSSIQPNPRPIAGGGLRARPTFTGAPHPKPSDRLGSHPSLR